MKDNKISNNLILNSYLDNVEIGSNCEIVNSVIKGHNNKEGKILIGDRVKIYNSVILSTKDLKEFSFMGEKISVKNTKICNDVTLELCKVLNCIIGEATKAVSSYLEFSVIGKKNNLRRFSNITLSYISDGNIIGSELSKTIIQGDGFVSEHYSSYLSLFAPKYYPIIDEYGNYKELGPLPNATNIGAGTVFANYSGRVTQFRPEPLFEKGTAIVFSSFTCINSKIVNRYGKVNEKCKLIELFERRDLTTCGFCSFIENKVTGRIPAFSYAGNLSPKKTIIGWVLEKKPGIVHTTLLNMINTSNIEVSLLSELVEGTIRFEMVLLNQELKNLNKSLFTKEQLLKGLHILEKNLDGRWKFKNKDEWFNSWNFKDGKWYYVGF